MPTKAKAKKLSQEELFPHNGFPYRLEVIEPDGTKKGTKRTAWFQCEWHLTKHINRYRITEGQIDVQDGHTLEVDPFAVKPKRKPRAKAPAKPKAKTTTKKPSATKASKKTTTKKATKPAAKTTRAKRTTKTAKKEAFSNLDTFFDKWLNSP